MPRFFFHLHDDLDVIDEDGRELPNVEAARAEAEKSARELACTEVLAGRLNLHHRIEVYDEQGKLVAAVCYGDVVEVETGPRDRTGGSTTS